MKLFQLIADAINPVLDELFPSDIQIIAEPGRYFAMSTTTMAVQIHSKRDYFAAPSVCIVKVVKEEKKIKDSMKES